MLGLVRGIRADWLGAFYAVRRRAHCDADGHPRLVSLCVCRTASKDPLGGRPLRGRRQPRRYPEPRERARRPAAIAVPEIGAAVHRAPSSNFRQRLREAGTRDAPLAILSLARDLRDAAPVVGIVTATSPGERPAIEQRHGERRFA